MLNPGLYETLQRVFGRVHISNAGRQTSITTETDSSGKPRERCNGSGEEYVTFCPNCGKDGKLSFHYLYGTQFEGSRKKRLHLVHCHACCWPDNWDERKKLWEKITNGVDSGDCEVPISAAAEPVTPIPFPADDDIVPLTSCLARSARQYLKRRNFDPEYLSSHWLVQWNDTQERLIWPIGNRGPRRPAWGYQTRCISDDPDVRCKYLFAPGFNKSDHLYGSNWASLEPGPLVVCEGVTSCWRMETSTVATFGCHISPRQQAEITELINRMERRYVVLFYDGNVQGEGVYQLMQCLRAAVENSRMEYSCKVRRVCWPAGSTNADDPANLTREQAWQMVADACRLQVDQLGLALDAFHDVCPYEGQVYQPGR